MSSAPKAPVMLTVNGIEVIYNHVILVLKGVSLSVPEGGIVALLGANGAGKTTTLKAISNLLRAERGLQVARGVREVDALDGAVLEFDARRARERVAAAAANRDTVSNRGSSGSGGGSSATSGINPVQWRDGDLIVQRADLVEAMTRVLGDDTLRATLAAGARSTAARFDTRIVLDEFARLTDAAIERRAASAGEARGRRSRGATWRINCTLS